jgi:hypothetical protein
VLTRPLIIADRFSPQFIERITKMDDTYSEPAPTRGSYIGVWFLASIAANIAGYVIGAVGFTGIRTMDDLMQRALFITPVSIIILVAITVFVYSLFPKLEMARVIPYFWLLGGLGTVLNMVRTANSGPDFPTGFYLLMIAEYVLTVLALTWSFRKQGRL